MLYVGFTFRSAPGFSNHLRSVTSLVGFYFGTNPKEQLGLDVKINELFALANRCDAKDTTVIDETESEKLPVTNEDTDDDENALTERSVRRARRKGFLGDENSPQTHNVPHTGGVLLTPSDINRENCRILAAGVHNDANAK